MTPRPISKRELDMVQLALSACPTGAATAIHRSGASGLVVTASCECGCDSVDFQCAAADEAPAIIADGLGEPPAGRSIGLLIFGTSQAIAGLEVYSFDDVPAELPELGSIRPFNSR
jgi:hypothetical protein